ncbi:MAG TPA: RNA methyltransferase [Opitutaceae bacterium]|nr:RNA methyltransferase [Opitutaceae bacterium]
MPRSPRPPEHAAVLTKADLQRLRALREKKHREELGVFVVEGEKVVGELLAAGFPLLEVYATPEWRRPPTALRVVPVTAGEMERISHFPAPSAVLAIGRIERRTLPAGALADGLTLALDGVQDAGNVGTLLRLADWFGFDRVLLSADCADVFHQKVINASMGSFARVATFAVDLPAALASAPAEVPILGCDLEGTSVYELPPLARAVVVIGSEGRGLSAEVARRITRRVTIPRFGRAESLNAAVAGAIVCAQLRRPA